MALQFEQGAALIWTRSGDRERISLPTGGRVRALVTAENGHVVAGDDLAAGDIFFLHRAGGRSTQLPNPASRSGAPRSGPVLLTETGRLEGSAWLEGTDPENLTIMAAPWNGTSWERVETVSISPTGPQLALSATVLDDGSWLLLWAGYDGSDDDIFWSRRADGVWSAARRLHADNQVPDLLPTVTSAEGGAHAAWSWFDGADYRIRTARWVPGGWLPGPTLDGRGPGRPELERLEGRAFLTYSTVAPHAWHLVEFEAEGRALASSVPARFTERPLVVLRRDAPAALAWPWRRATESP